MSPIISNANIIPVVTDEIAIGGGPPALATIDNNFSMEFDGADDVIDIGNFTLIDNISKFSLSLWYNPDFVNVHYRIWGKYSSNTTWLGLQATNTGQIQGLVSNGVLAYSTGAPTELTAGTWNHLVLVFDGTEGTPDDRIKMYVNGQETASYTVTGTLPTTTPPTLDYTAYGKHLWIGSSGWPGGVPPSADLVNGNIDEVGIWNVVLSDIDIERIYNATSAGTPDQTADLSDLSTPPIAWYRMGD